ncbi:MAG TPA: hypothetical protein VH701_22235 [Vicinamibacterales bacterium]|jgi:hypothetical protein
MSGTGVDEVSEEFGYRRSVVDTVRNSPFNFFFGSLYPVLVRGQGDAATGEHRRAAAEFRKILDHPGLMMADEGGRAWRRH